MTDWGIERRPLLLNIRDKGYRELFEAAMLMEPTDCLVKEFDTSAEAKAYSNKLRAILYWHAKKGRYRDIKAKKRGTRVYIVKEQ